MSATDRIDYLKGLVAPAFDQTQDPLQAAEPTTYAQEFARIVPYLSMGTRFKDAFSQRGFHVRSVAEAGGNAAVLQFEDDSLIALVYQGQTWRVLMDVSPSFVSEAPKPITGEWLSANVGATISLLVLLDEVKLVAGQWSQYVLWKGQHLDHALRLDAGHTIAMPAPTSWHAGWHVGEAREVTGTIARKEVWDNHRQTVLKDVRVSTGR